MKYLFIEAKSTGLEIKIPEEIKNKKVGLLASIQFLYLLKDVKKNFKNGIIGGQVTGCNVSNAMKIKNKVDCFFILSEGRFHAIEVARKTKKSVYISTGDKITEQEIIDYEKRLTGKKIRFYNAKKLGILVSLKPGQYNLKLAKELKNKLKNKESYILMADNIDINSLENFSGIDMFINTACSRIESNNIINAGDIE